MTVVYEYFKWHSSEILLRRFAGEITAEDIINSWEYLINNDILTREHIGVLNDIREADFKMNMETFKVLLKYLRDHDIFSGMKIAVIVDSPEKVIFPMVGADATGLNIKPFATPEAAAHWIIN